MITAPIAISGFAQSPLNSARAASAAWVRGLSVAEEPQPVRRERQRQQDARQEESGRATPLTSGASASSLLRISAAAYESGANGEADQDEQGERDDRAAEVDLEAERDRHDHHHDRLASRIATSRSERPRSIAMRLIGVTRMRSTTPYRSSAISPKPTKAAAEDGDLDEQARERTS